MPANTSKENQKSIGVIGSGSFGTAISALLAHNSDVLLYTRDEAIAREINTDHKHQGYPLSERIVATTDPEQFCKDCRLIFPVVPSQAMRETIRVFAPYLRPLHVLIHGTKGFDLDHGSDDLKLSREQVSTMSEVIAEESLVVRIGCLSGPNLAREIMAQKPTATVVASQYDEVIDLGQKYLQGPRFYVFGTHDIIGAEIAGALKNIVALGSGILMGKDLGKNMQGMLITRGLNEMIHLGKAMGSGVKAFLGTAGIGDLVTTATSDGSRNFQFGYKLGQGASLKELLEADLELAEGVKTLEIAMRLIRFYKLNLPILEVLYRVVYEGADILNQVELLMRFPFATDVDFL